MSDELSVPVYALGQPSRRTGLGGLSLKTTIVGGSGFFIFLLCQMMGASTIGYFVILPITIIVSLLVSLNFAGRSLAQACQMVFKICAVATKANIFMSLARLHEFRVVATVFQEAWRALNCLAHWMVSTMNSE